MSHQRNSEVGDDQSITILVLNGKTGKPVEDEKVNICLERLKMRCFLKPIQTEKFN
jgi:5-hydroxyisourate hydrolase-like protein (transthyretin family)